LLDSRSLFLRLFSFRRNRQEKVPQFAVNPSPNLIKYLPDRLRRNAFQQENFSQKLDPKPPETGAEGPKTRPFHKSPKWPF
jgi:hypothetical protein